MKIKNDSNLSDFDKFYLSFGDIKSLEDYYKKPISEIIHVKKYIKLVCSYKIIGL